MSTSQLEWKNASDRQKTTCSASRYSLSNFRHPAPNLVNFHHITTTLEGPLPQVNLGLVNTSTPFQLLTWHQPIPMHFGWPIVDPFQASCQDLSSYLIGWPPMSVYAQRTSSTICWKPTSFQHQPELRLTSRVAFPELGNPKLSDVYVWLDKGIPQWVCLKIGYSPIWWLIIIFPITHPSSFCCLYINIYIYIYTHTFIIYLIIHIQLN